MKADYEIAQEAQLLPIVEVVKTKLGIDSDKLEPYGKYMAKIPLTLIDEDKVSRSHLVLVTSISPTKSGNGKTTVTVGLNDALNRIGCSSVAVLREPSLGPCFGMKGGACGGGYSQVVPMDKINLHFTGDLHAITVANNMICAFLDNYLLNNPDKKERIANVTFRRCLDVSDRTLRRMTAKDGSEVRFNITAASELMAVFCLCSDFEDLRRKIDRMILARYTDGTYLFCSELNITGAIVALLSEALNPNIVQSLEHNPVIIHGGPFANIAHGCNSVIATKTGLSLADYAVTEAGFGSDLGAEKFWDIKCRLNGLDPAVAVLVVTVPALKDHGEGSVEKGISANLLPHIESLQRCGHRIVVACNQFAGDTAYDYKAIEEACGAVGVPVVMNSSFTDGSAGSIDLARKVVELADSCSSVEKKFVYELDWSVMDKIRAVLTDVYHYDPEKCVIEIDDNIKDEFEQIADHPLYANLPICIAKTQYSFRTDAENPDVFRIRAVEIDNGAGFIVIQAGAVMRMPGLPKRPCAENIDFRDGRIIGLS